MTSQKDKTITTWKESIQFKMSKVCGCDGGIHSHDETDCDADSWDNFCYCTISDDELEEECDFGFGIETGKPFTLWTKNWVYFPVMYDGSEWVECVPRNPCNISSNHVGG